MKHFNFEEILESYYKNCLDYEYPKGYKSLLIKETFICKIQKFLKYEVGENLELIPLYEEMEEVLISYPFLIGEKDSTRRFQKHCAIEKAHKLYFQELELLERQKEEQAFLSWAEPLAQKYPKLITVDQIRMCVWVEAGGENSHTTFVTHNIRGVGLVGGGYENSNQNPSAYSLEEAKHLLEKRAVYEEIAALKRKPQTAKVKARLQELKAKE